MFKVSIIIPIFNVKDYLKRALDSILDQTMDINDIQVIMVDDKSTDGSDIIAKEYVDKYPNFFLHRLNKNSGSAGKPRSIGLKHVKSNYVMFLDPDDEFLPDYCETMYDFICKFDVDVVKCNFINVYNGQEELDFHFDKSISKKLITNTDSPLKYVAIWSGIHKFKLIKDNNISFPNFFGEDIVFSVNEFLCMNNLLFINDYFGYKYYDNDDSHAKKPNSNNIQGIINSFILTKNLCKSFNREDILSDVLGQQIKSVFSRIYNNNESIKVRINLLKELYDLEKDIPKLYIDSKILNFVNILLMKKLFYLSLFSLKLLFKVYKSNTLYKVINNFK